MNFSRPFISRPIGTTLLAIGLFLVGVVAYSHLPVASLPTVEFPDHSRQRQPSRRRPRDYGGHCRGAAGAAARRDRRRHRTDVGQRRRLQPASRMQFDLTRKIDGAARDVQAALNAAMTDLPSDLPTVPTFRKVEPGCGARPDPGADLENAAPERDLRRRR